MTTTLWSELMHWVGAHPLWGVVVTFMIAYTETLAFVGYAVPGLALFLAVGILVGSGALPLLATLTAATSGAFLGDLTSYILGRHFGERLLAWPPIAKRSSLVARGRAFCERHGTKSVFLGRFVGVVRPLVPVVVGVGGFPPLEFVCIDSVAAILWAPLTLFPGYAIGAALGYAAQGAVRFALLLLMMLVGVYVAGRVTRAYIPRVHHFLRRVFNHGLGLLRRVSGELNVEVSSVRLGDRGMLWWGFLSLYGLGWLVITILRRLSGHRHPGLFELIVPTPTAVASIMPLLHGLALTLSPVVWLGLLLVVLLVVSLAKEYALQRMIVLLGLSCAFFDLVLVPLILGTGSATGLSPHSLFTPVAVFLTVFGLIGDTTPARIVRGSEVVIGVFLLIAAVAAILLHQIWLSVALGTGILGSAWGILLLHVRHRSQDSTIPPYPVLFVVLFFLGTALVVGVLRSSFPSRHSTSELVTMQAWWQTEWNGALAGPPGRGRVPINVEYVGRLGNLGRVLERQGWHRPPVWNVRRLLYWFAPGVPTRRLPLLPLIRAGKPPAAIWLKPRTERRAWIFVLWKTRILVGHEKVPLWIGHIARFRFHRYPLVTIPHVEGLSQRAVSDLGADLSSHTGFRLRTARTQTGWQVLLVRQEPGLTDAGRPPSRGATPAKR